MDALDEIIDRMEALSQTFISAAVWIEWKEKEMELVKEARAILKQLRRKATLWDRRIEELPKEE